MSYFDKPKPTGGFCIDCHYGVGEPIVCPSCWKKRLNGNPLKATFLRWYRDMRKARR